MLVSNALNLTALNGSGMLLEAGVLVALCRDLYLAACWIIWHCAKRSFDKYVKNTTNTL
ncbi:Uncharacterised protein [Kluyvera cryocrescens]|uniref:Uncharacterized protein n=1 Tax=Kluyvera cryocrescens TaxID=580 RepID=A0A485CYJ0_KLUCR|nr:Uncharacterised protein [Kluyvera cryocrescens]